MVLTGQKLAKKTVTLPKAEKVVSYRCHLIMPYFGFVLGPLAIVAFINVGRILREKLLKRLLKRMRT